MGLPIGEAVAKLYERVPVPEANFFGIVISIQQKSGGNLSEALGNLSKRAPRAQEDEAARSRRCRWRPRPPPPSSASLPFIVGVLVYVTSPHYIELLWTTIHGRIWMGIGGVMMVDAASW